MKARPCTCRLFRHALSMEDRARVVTARAVAKEQGKDLYAGYLDVLLERCPTANPEPEGKPLPASKGELRSEVLRLRAQLAEVKR